MDFEYKMLFSPQHSDLCSVTSFTFLLVQLEFHLKPLHGDEYTVGKKAFKNQNAKDKQGTLELYFVQHQ